jgi:hypothetical protein
MTKVGGGDPVKTIALLNQYAVRISDELAYLRSLAPQVAQLEQEHEGMAALLTDTERLADYYNKLEFDRALSEDGMPWIKEFRTEYPNATFDNFTQWKRQMFAAKLEEAGQAQGVTQVQQHPFIPPQDQQGWIEDVPQAQYDMPSAAIGLPQRGQTDRGSRNPLPPMNTMQAPQGAGARGQAGIDELMNLYHQSPQSVYRQLDSQHLGQFIFGE